jgi:hypothetical protein
MNEEDRKLCKDAIALWGKETQLDMAIEECAELINAIVKHRRNRASGNEIIEEAVDVEFMLQQIRVMFDYPIKVLQDETVWDDLSKQKRVRLKEMIAKTKERMIKGESLNVKKF